MEYPKTENLFNRGPNHKCTIGDFRCPEFRAVNRWRVTEKIDGMNMRVIFHPAVLVDGSEYEEELRYQPKVLYRGRTDAAMIPPSLLEWLQIRLPLDKLASFFDHSVILFGEGYGGSIQRGSGYRPTPAFRLFDVFYNDYQYFATAEELEAIAAGLAIPVAPLLGVLTTDEVVELVQAGKADPDSCALTAHSDGSSQDPFEGVVAVSDPVVFDRYGNRIKFKLKVKDL